MRLLRRLVIWIPLLKLPADPGTAQLSDPRLPPLTNPTEIPRLAARLDRTRTCSRATNTRLGRKGFDLKRS
jgi:hypothetical protein